MTLEVHLPEAEQQFPNRLPVHVSCTSSPQRPSRLVARPVCVGAAEVDVVAGIRERG